MQLPAEVGKLPPRKRRFIEEYVKTGDERGAYVKAGYRDSHLAGRKARALTRELSKEISLAVGNFASSNEMAVLGLRVLRELAEGADSEAVKLQAGKEILSRTLPEAPKEVNFNHTVAHMSEEAILARVQELYGVVSEQ